MEIGLDKNLTGKKFFYENAINTKNEDRLYKKIEVICGDCNKIRRMRVDAWKKRKSDLCHSCCARRTVPYVKTHGKSNTKIYKTWSNMVYRCFNEKAVNFKYYGGLGISVDSAWIEPKNGFTNFYNWATSNGYAENLEIDRIDPEGDYCPDNCQFISKIENVARMNNLFGVVGKVAKLWKGQDINNLLGK